jgi:hypothetical protein
LATARIRIIVDRSTCCADADARHLPTHQLEPEFVLLGRRQEPLAAAAGAVAPTLLFGQD